MDPDFSLILDREETGETLYFGVAWYNVSTFGPSIKIDVTHDLDKGSVCKLVPRKGYQFNPKRVSGDKPDMRIRHGKREADIGWAWIVEDKWGARMIRFELEQPVAAGEIIFCNPLKVSDEILNQDEPSE